MCSISKSKEPQRYVLRHSHPPLPLPKIFQSGDMACPLRSFAERLEKLCQVRQYAKSKNLAWYVSAQRGWRVKSKYLSSLPPLFFFNTALASENKSRLLPPSCLGSWWPSKSTSPVRHVFRHLSRPLIFRNPSRSIRVATLFPGVHQDIESVLLSCSRRFKLMGSFDMFPVLGAESV
jgi:hypothetical protein